MQIHISSLAEFKKFAQTFAKTLRPGQVIGFIGELGAGKTTFIKYLLKSVGVRKNITSPTFVLMIPYKIRVPRQKIGTGPTKTAVTFYHMDLYRTGGYKDIQTLGIEELWANKDNIILIEWADKIKKHLPPKTVILKITIKKSGRIIKIVNAPKALKKMLK